LAVSALRYRQALKVSVARVLRSQVAVRGRVRDQGPTCGMLNE
jgi:hypothetical protein